jgi:hypothetical protein
MKIFDHSNPRHMEILREEYTRVKDIVEAYNTTYSADKLWGNMTPDERKSALYVAKAPNPEEYLDGTWDDIPADLQDLIDLSEYERATSSQTGRSLYRGTKYAMQQDPQSNHFVMAFLRQHGKATIEDLTVGEMSDLNLKIWRFVNRNKPKQIQNPNATSMTADDYKANQGRGGWQGD